MSNFFLRSIGESMDLRDGSRSGFLKFRCADSGRMFSLSVSSEQMTTVLAQVSPRPATKQPAPAPPPLERPRDPLAVAGVEDDDDSPLILRGGVSPFGDEEEEL